MNVIRRFASYNASTRLTDAVLADYRLFNNIISEKLVIFY